MGKVETNLKQCCRCKKWKDRNKFSRNRERKDSLSSNCKQCDCDYRHKRLGGGVFKKYFTYKQSHRVVDGVKEKRCSQCETWKAQSEFYKKHKNKDGLAGWCKKCADKATNKCREQRSAVRN